MKFHIFIIIIKSDEEFSPESIFHRPTEHRIKNNIFINHFPSTTIFFLNSLQHEKNGVGTLYRPTENYAKSLK